MAKKSNLINELQNTLATIGAKGFSVVEEKGHLTLTVISNFFESKRVREKYEMIRKCAELADPEYRKYINLVTIPLTEKEAKDRGFEVDYDVRSNVHKPTEASKISAISIS